MILKSKNQFDPKITNYSPKKTKKPQKRHEKNHIFPKNPKKHQKIQKKGLKF